MRWWMLWLLAQAPAVEEMERQQARQLLAIRRVYVDRLSGGQNSGALRDMIIAALQRTRLFILTEDESRADAYLRGAAEDLIFSDVRSVREGLQVRAAGSAAQRERSESDSASAGVSVGETDDRYTRERKHEAVAALRLVARNGDVLWSTTQESLGAKYKGSSADVADKVAKDLERAVRQASGLSGVKK
jgi:hypothetical protein